ncbi:MAG: MASE3 domain-containing protein [Deltaproteobacteria bacterium]|nr:MASE3 domain-containing protein [Deltaproteobacteria bacterium]
MQAIIHTLKEPLVRLARILIVLAAAVGLYLTTFNHYILFHSLVEMFSVAIAWAIFALAWNSRHLMQNNYLLLLGIAYLFVGNLDLLHTLAYKGMQVFPGYGANLPTQLWIASRYLEGVSFLIAPVFLTRSLYPRLTLAGYLFVFTFILLSIFSWGLFPVCYVEGQGLTTYKIVSEYIICGILAAALGFLLLTRHNFDKNIWRLVAWSLLAMIASEISFTYYVGVYDLANMVGHYFKILSFYFIYKAVIATGISEPFSLVFRELKQTQEALERANDVLESQVRERTAALEATNVQLLKEIEERRRFENSLRESEEKLRHLTSQILQTQEQERQRISRELHDDLGQSLIILKLQLSGLQRTLSGSQVKLKQKLDDVLAQVRELIDKVRRISLNLSPPVLEDFGLETALKQLFSDFSESQNLKFDVDMETVSPYLSKAAQIGIYRIFQETLANISKHAGASEVTIRINRRYNYLHFLVADNGRGFDIAGNKAKAPNRRGMGLASIEERVHMFDGTFEIWSKPDSGTRISFVLPAQELSKYSKMV